MDGLSESFEDDDDTACRISQERSHAIEVIENVTQKFDDSIF